jgi:mRNA-degrading endonuclease HigB of HigAB toxin-antitoxin module
LIAKKPLKEKEIKYPTYEEVVEIHKYIMSGEGNISPKQKAAIDKMNANLKPRPLERIPLILDALKTIWEKYPDQRLGQLLLNYVFHDADYRDKTNIEMYAQEDNITLENLFKKLESEKIF